MTGTKDDPGLIPRLGKDLFEQIEGDLATSFHVCVYRLYVTYGLMGIHQWNILY
jgi:hypothetical protein